MSIKMRPITQRDKDTMIFNRDVARVSMAATQRLDKAFNEANTVVSSSIFGKADHRNIPNDTDKVFEDEYTRVGYIDLCKPVLNPFLSGRTAPVWRCLLGMSERSITNIINGDLIWDRNANDGKGDLIRVQKVGNEVYRDDRFIFGAELLKFLIKDIDIDERIKDIIYNTCIAPYLSRDEKSYVEEQNLAYKAELRKARDLGDSIGDYVPYYGRIFDSGDIDNFTIDPEIHIHLYDSWYLDISESEMSDETSESNPYSRQQYFAWDLIDADDSTVLDSDESKMKQFNPLDVLITIKRKGIKVLEDQILEFVFVLPYGYRPSVDYRVDPLTVQYNKLVLANTELGHNLNRNDCSVHTICGKYKDVVRYIRNIFVGDDSVTDKKVKEYKSLSDNLSSKQGLIRDKMQGARFDYSGRAVIVSDPELPLDMIGVPIKMLMKIMEPRVIWELRKNVDTIDGKQQQWWWKNLSTISTSEFSEIGGRSYEQYVWDYFENGGKYDQYGLIGRNPTLFYLGMRGFRIKPIKGDAIALSPLVVMPFNADHDGDQMHFEAILNQNAYKELKNGIDFNTNMYYPKNGENTVVVRHEILYGLWVCYKKSMDGEGQTYNVSDIKSRFGTNNAGDREVIYNCVCSQNLNVYDRVNIDNRGPIPAGRIAIEYALQLNPNNPYSSDLSENIMSDDFKFDAKTLTKYADRFGMPNVFHTIINRLVHLGFSVARIWPPNISVIIDKEVTKEVQELISKFNERMLEREEYVDLGIEIESEFSAYYSKEWKDLENVVTKKLISSLNDSNGYVSMMESGAKGDKSNIRQIFGLKGRVQKNDISTFNSIVTGSYANQLTGLDHFVTAYGSRKGIADKIIATAEPGYMSRKLGHACSTWTITKEDCGTTDGMRFELDTIVPFLDPSAVSKLGTTPPIGASPAEVKAWQEHPDTATQWNAAINYLAKILLGHYVIWHDPNLIKIDSNTGESYYDENGANAFTSIKVTSILQARNIIAKQWSTFGYVDMRSPIYCKCPCCQKCYGIDIAAGNSYDSTMDNSILNADAITYNDVVNNEPNETYNLPKIGRAIGFIAAQTIGEPGTQMTMKNFQKGGVVTEANLTSSFELIDDYLELHNFAHKRRNKKGVSTYDVISPVSGFVKVQYLGNGGKRVIVTATPDEDDRTNLINGNTKIVIQEDTVVKPYVHKGESFQRVTGDLDMREMLKYNGYDSTAAYLALKLYDIFSTQDIAFTHFEVVVAAMTLCRVLNNVQPRLTSGSIRNGSDSEFVAGSYMTLQEYNNIGIDSCNVCRTLAGLKALPKYRSDLLESMIMENIDSFVPRSILLNPNDSMANPITRAMFGLGLGIGTDMH